LRKHGFSIFDIDCTKRSMRSAPRVHSNGCLVPFIAAEIALVERPEATHSGLSKNIAVHPSSTQIGRSHPAMQAFTSSADSSRAEPSNPVDDCRSGVLCYSA
jgi:hypothetical protein